MERKSLRFPQLNLRRSGIRSLQIIATYDADERRITLLRDKFAVERAGQLQFAMTGVTQYVTRDEARAVHSVSATFTRHPNFPGDIDAEIDYRQGSPDTLLIKPLGTWQDVFLRTLQALGEPRETQVHAAIGLGDQDPDELWFPLPISLAGHSPEATFEIRGVRGVRMGVEIDEPDYMFILDRSFGEQVTLVAEWKHEGPLVPEALRSMLTRAEGIAREFVAHS